MKTENRDTILEILERMNGLIMKQRQVLHSESTSPAHSGDRMDDIIATSRANVKKLRELREQLEDLAPELL